MASGRDLDKSTQLFNFGFICLYIFVPRAHNPSGQHKGSRALAGADVLSMSRVLLLHFQPIRIARFDSESVNRALPVLEPPEVSILGADQKDRSLLERECSILM